MNNANTACLVQPETGSQSAVLIRAAYSMAKLFVKLFGPYFRVTVLADMVTKAGVEVAEARCRREDPDNKPTYSRLVMMTGVSLNRLKPILEEPKELGDRHICTEAAILTYWHNCMHDVKTREPAVLPIFGYADSFQGIVAKVGGRGVSVQTVLPRLLANGNVEMMGKHDVRLLNPNWRLIEDNEDEVLDYGVRAISSLVSTIEHNLAHRNEPDKKWVERRLYSTHIPREKKQEALRKTNQLLLQQQEQVEELLKSYEAASVESEDLISVGAGYYCWQECKDDPIEVRST